MLWEPEDYFSVFGAVGDQVQGEESPDNHIPPWGKVEDSAIEIPETCTRLLEALLPESRYALELSQTLAEDFVEKYQLFKLGMDNQVSFLISQTLAEDFVEKYQLLKARDGQQGELSQTLADDFLRITNSSKLRMDNQVSFLKP
jgi:hypothetical protein